MEALLFFFILCHCSWQESAQSGRKLFLSASSLGLKTLTDDTQHTKEPPHPSSRPSSGRPWPVPG